MVMSLPINLTRHIVKQYDVFFKIWMLLLGKLKSLARKFCGMCVILRSSFSLLTDSQILAIFQTNEIFS